jgi:tetratricopeptide (TPR) repeat protein
MHFRRTLTILGVLTLILTVSFNGHAQVTPVAPPPAAEPPKPQFELQGTALQNTFQRAVAAYSKGQYLPAAVVFDTIVQKADPNATLVHESQFFLGVSLYELGLHHSALVRFEPIIDVGAKHSNYRKTLPYLLRIARNFSAEPNVLEKIAQYETKIYPPALADELHFLVGQYQLGQDNLADALSRLRKVGKKTGALYVRARYLEGVIHVAMSKLELRRKSKDKAELEAMTRELKSAATNFKAVLNYQKSQGGGKVVKRVAAMSRLALGRLFYSTRQYPVALRYYDLVDEKHPDWLSAIFEVSWVYFQLKKYPRALGNLHTLNSPFFEDQYFPESRVLQALILFYHCRYKDALTIVREFVRDFYPLMKELRKQLNQFPNENAFYLWLARLSKSSNSKFSERFKRIFNGALADRKLRRKFAFVSVLNRELRRVDGLLTATPKAKVLLNVIKEDLTSYRSLVVGEAGSLAQTRLKAVLKDLRQHLAGALKIKGEILKAQRDALSPKIKKELKAAAAAKFILKVDAEHVEWPFTGEYWKDELGSYIYAISSKCKFDAKK